MNIIKFKVKNFRSLLDTEVQFHKNLPITISGENNIGKTNFLRALNIFFNHYKDKNLYNLKTDVPYHIYHGSRGGGTKTELTATFSDISNSITTISVTFNTTDKIKYKLNGKKVDSKTITDILDNFYLFFIESNNIHLPSLISAILERDGLLALDKKRSKQTTPLEKLREFIELSKNAIDDIQKNINLCFKELTNFDSFLKDAQISIKFAEFEKLRDVVKTMTSITLNDGNNNEIETKGSGAQRAVFLSLMRYISQNMKDKTIIWAIDEPEAFLQPKLQKQVFSTFKNMCKNDAQTIILTTHSQYFIDLSNVNTINLFECESERKQYQRKPGKVFYAINTINKKSSSSSKKINDIKKHLGIANNDGWELLPFNILVEGEGDKKYLEKLFDVIEQESPNIIYSGGASKIGGYLQYCNTFAKDNPFQKKPKIICIFDNDDEGREQAKKINPLSLKNIEIEIIFIPKYNGSIITKENLNKNSENWEIEDFIPLDLMFKTANEILKKDGYKIITTEQRNNRGKVAHSKKMILDYLDECSTQRNPSLELDKFNSFARKRELCQYFCEKRTIDEIKSSLSESHKTFLNSLIETEK